MNYALNAIQYTMNQDQLQLQSILHNISNMNTPAYKRQLIETPGFSEMLQPERTALPSETHHFFTPGTFQETSNPAHLALSDNSFFQVKTESGIFYTRRGDFSLNKTGELHTPSGAILQSMHGNIRLDATDFTINASGEIFTNNRKIDQIHLVQFAHPELLQYMGEGLFKTQELPMQSPGIHPVLQGHLEKTNVQTLEEMGHLTQTARHFETSQRILRMVDNLTATAISQLGESHV